MEKEKNVVSKWLTQLQQESWNLELLISGFSIFLLMNAGEHIIDLMEYFDLHSDQNNGSNSLMIASLGITYLATIVLTINLIIHVFLRGFWIGTIGLRSVQEKTNFEKLKYTPFFTEKLKKKVLNLDDLLVRLDTICSVIFSFTFLVIFMFFSVFLYILFIAVVDTLYSTIENFVGADYHYVFDVFMSILFMLILLTSTIYLIDTLSLGFFKRQKWFQKIYYPIYVFYGYITLSGIYRGIYYHLASRFSKRIVMMLLIAYVLLFALYPMHKYEQYPFYPDNETNNKLYQNRYDDRRQDQHYIKYASIPSMNIDQNFLPLFIRYNIGDNETIQQLCTDYQPSKSVGIISGIKISHNGINLSTPYVEEKNPEKLLNCLSQLYTIYLNDSLVINPEFYYYSQPIMDEKGIQTMLSIQHLPKGKNEIKVTRKEYDDVDEILNDVEYTRIPFWLE